MIKNIKKIKFASPPILAPSISSCSLKPYTIVPILSYLTKRHYFDGTQFYRVVPNFVIQGGNSDDMEIAKRRSKIGTYLLPPDTKQGYKHDRGVISMPSSEIDDAYKMASPYQFFIVQGANGAHHLDGRIYRLWKSHRWHGCR